MDTANLKREEEKTVLETRGACYRGLFFKKKSKKRLFDITYTNNLAN